MVELQDILNYSNALLDIDSFDDYCPNGLQVEGKTSVKKIMTGVTACQALIEQSILYQADMLLVHHGFFWRGEPETLTGTKGRRIASLMKHNINLVAYHLPLDAHPQLGNNVELGKILGLEKCEGLMAGKHPNLFWRGELASVMSFSDFLMLVEKQLKRKPLAEQVLGTVKRVGWCTGGGQDYLILAKKYNCDTYLTGEVSERTIHIARENNINFISAGHHATERYGIKALGEHLANKFQLAHQFIDIDNPA